MNYKSMSKKILCLLTIGVMLSPNAVHAESLVTKDESVYVNLDQNGIMKDEVVSDWLKSNSAINVTDTSNLTGITNVEGNDKPVITGEELKWNSSSNNIFYQGKTNSTLPLAIKLTYYFNGEEINPKTIAGKSGHIKIKMQLINSASHQININGNNKTIFTPITAAAVVTLPIDTFKNVTISDGQIISEGNNQVATFVGFPGMNESLGLPSTDLTITLPDSLEITADTNNFKMLPILITATPKLPTIKGLQNATNIDELKQGLFDLKSASSQLVDGSGKLKDGLETAQSGALMLNDGLLKAQLAVNNSGTLLAQNNDKISLITDASKVTAENKLLTDSFIAMNMDTSLISDPDVQKLMAPQTIGLAQKTFSDYSALNVTSIITDFQQFKPLMTAENLANVNNLMNDTDPLINTVLPAAARLKPIAAPLSAVLGNADNLTALNLLISDSNKIYENKTAVGSALEKLSTIVPSTDEDKANFAALATNNTTSAAAITNIIKNSTLDDTTKAGLEAEVAGYSALTSKTASLVSDPNFSATMSLLGPTINHINNAGDLKLFALSQGLLSSLTPANINDIQTVLGALDNIDKLSTDIKNNQNNIAAIKALLTKASDPNTADTLAKVSTLEIDLNTAEPMITAIKSKLTPETIANLSNAPTMIGQLTSMQKDLKNSQKILEVMQDALKEGNVKQANALISSLPSLSDGVNQLADGSSKLLGGFNQLTSGATDLNSGMNKFNSDGILKLDSQISPKISTLQDMIAEKDALIKLSDDYGAFSGTAKGMSAETKFIMKTDEITVPIVTPISVKNNATSSKITLLQWIKQIVVKVENLL